tara:strand:- start:2803 stop:3132 length:330 start_codon:yes stop_codon:yes gene_type:complete
LDASQKSPVEEVQVAEPQAHVAKFSALPSIMAQLGIAHRFSSAKQRDESSQSAVPQLHFSVLRALPSVMAQAAEVLHELNEVVQKNPVVDVQTDKPQAHVSGLAVTPAP